MVQDATRHEWRTVMLDRIFASKPAEFESAFGVSESVSRLTAATKRSVFSAMGSQAAVGTVREDRVTLQRVIPVVGNSFKPFFIGQFVSRNGRVVLSGTFRMHWFTRVFMTLWFAG